MKWNYGMATANHRAEDLKRMAQHRAGLDPRGSTKRPAISRRAMSHPCDNTLWMNRHYRMIQCMGQASRFALPCNSSHSKHASTSYIAISVHRRPSPISPVHRQSGDTTPHLLPALCRERHSSALNECSPQTAPAFLRFPNVSF